ncbi:MAG: exodeoxyribonuclease VII small subunit [Clostridia bacterium]|nr:exodeoxyribonuclease VII small subunit [Clostridia bacterium]MBQ8742779.1 exodeoxyribonuclease VII small subunit [Clostridia bacterium]MBQ9749082.1 exodeoxyribonuclease VII small subunit [Clostridia bacterium]
MAEKNKQSFEEMISELEKIVASLESGDVGLEEAIELYKRGTLLSSECAKLLENAEKQIKILTRSPDGDVVEVDFEEN